MIIIKDLSFDYVSMIDNFLGYSWRKRDLKPSKLSQGCVDVMLSNDAVIWACPYNSYITIQYQGKPIVIDAKRFSEVVIA